MMETTTTSKSATTAPTVPKPSAPRWYTRGDMVHLLERMNYSSQIAVELADWMALNLQLAFNKGFQVRGWAEYVRTAAEHLQESRRLDWVLENRHLRVQGNDAAGWAVLDCSDGLEYLTDRFPTAREAIDAGMLKVPLAPKPRSCEQDAPILRDADAVRVMKVLQESKNTNG